MNKDQVKKTVESMDKVSKPILANKWYLKYHKRKSIQFLYEAGVITLEEKIKLKQKSSRIITVNYTIGLCILMFVFNLTGMYKGIEWMGIAITFVFWNVGWFFAYFVYCLFRNKL